MSKRHDDGGPWLLSWTNQNDGTTGEARMPAATYKSPRTPLLCVSCRAHLGWWAEDDPRCPSCRYEATRPEPAAACPTCGQPLEVTR